MKRLTPIGLMRDCATTPEARLDAMEALLREDYDAAEVFEVFRATDAEVATVDARVARRPAA